jgi:hypothetical protein
MLGLFWKIDTHLQAVRVWQGVGAESTLRGSQVRQEITIAFGAGYGIICEHDSAIAELRLHNLERRKCKGRPDWEIVSSNETNEVTSKDGLSHCPAEVGPPWADRFAMSQADRPLSNLSRLARQLRIVPNID